MTNIIANKKYNQISFNLQINITRQLLYYTDKSKYYFDKIFKLIKLINILCEVKNYFLYYYMLEKILYKKYNFICYKY
jgi:hypothetical protein